MSTFLHVYCVPLDALKSVAGSGDRTLLERIEQTFDGEIARIDRLSEQSVEVEVYPYLLPVHDAVRQIVEGASLDRDVGQVYVHAYELICAALAYERCGNWSPLANSEALFERIDVALAGHHATATMASLTSSGPVFPVPIVDCFPSPGWWPPGTIAQSHHALEQKPRIWQRWFGGESDPEIASAIEEIRRWLAVAVRNPGSCLVGVHHF